MNTTMLIKTATLLLLATFLMYGASAQNQEKIVALMHAYDKALVKMDVDSIAFLYAQDGELGDVAKGRDSIKHFLEKFANYRVLFNQSVTDSIKMFDDSAVQKGTYTQVTILPPKDTAHLKGQFEAHWIWQPKDGWKIKKMITKPN